MTTERLSFAGRFGSLAGALVRPPADTRAYALFAHCFTCGKDSIAASRISRALALEGIAVLRFDFTGLGGSDGDFASSDFSANVDDIVAAADYLRREHGAPALLIGHSLGGTAVLAAARRIPEAAAIVTIGAPASPEHVVQQFAADVERIDRDGAADVSLGGRRFRIHKSFLDEIRNVPMEQAIRGLRRALLVMHSPVDSVVDIGDASRIFAAALHPKSFISLDKADHLLRDSSGAVYAARAIAGWASRYVHNAEEKTGEDVARGAVRVREGNGRFVRRVASDDHAWLADEPETVGGDNLGPDPYEHLLAALGTCTSMTLRMYATRKAWPVDAITVDLGHSQTHAEDCEDCDDPQRKIDVIRREVRLEGALSPEQRSRLIEIADRCPVHKTLTGALRIETEEVG